MKHLNIDGIHFINKILHFYRDKYGIFNIKIYCATLDSFNFFIRYFRKSNCIESKIDLGRKFSMGNAGYVELYNIPDGQIENVESCKILLIDDAYSKKTIESVFEPLCNDDSNKITFTPMLFTY